MNSEVNNKNTKMTSVNEAIPFTSSWSELTSDKLTWIKIGN